MAVRLTEEQIQALRAVDTPTLCNAIETFEVRGRVDGFLGMDIRCLFPDLGSLVGYAIPVKVDSTTPGVKQDPDVWRKWLEAMQDSWKPGVLVFQDIGPQPKKSAHIGEIMATLAMRFGVMGIVTDGGVRDLSELRRMGFQCFAPGSVASHGNPRLIEVNVPVEIDGVRIEPGDLLQADANGVTLLPDSIATRAAAAAERFRAGEAELLNYINSPDFTVEGFLERKFTH